MSGLAFITARMHTLWSDRADFTWLTKPHADAGYLGWLNRGNLGDESMFWGHQKVSPRELRRLPQQSFGLRMAKNASVGTLLLGGGTLLGRREWGIRLEEAIETFQPERIITLGVGVEEPAFALEKNLISERELKSQVSLLHSFARIGVRGPRSQKYLADLGIESEVLGDPALVLNSEREKRSSNRRPRILISLAEVHDGYVLDGDRMREQVMSAAKQIASCYGADLIGLPMERKDISAIKRADPSIPTLKFSKDIQKLVTEISRADMVISERLHPNIIAAAVDTPFIAIGYKPKTFDFVESIEASDRVVDSRELKKEDVLECARMLATGDQEQLKLNVYKLADKFKGAITQELT